MAGQDSLSIWVRGGHPRRGNWSANRLARYVVVAFFPGSHNLRVSASDGAANTEREIVLHVFN